MQTIFLGSGFVGDHFRRLYPYSIHTSRSPEKLRHQIRGVVFDSESPATWENVRRLKPEGVVISFPLTSCSFPDEMDEFLRSLTERIVVIGTTSGFREDLCVITDDSPIDTGNKRSLAEEAFRLKGAVILHSAGIYGEGRNPLDWIRRGMIKDTQKTANLIHAEDLSRACRFILENFHPGARYVLSDNHPYRWQDIINFALERKLLLESEVPVPVQTASAESIIRVVKSCKLLEEGFNLKHPELLEELKHLEEPV